MANLKNWIKDYWKKNNGYILIIIFILSVLGSAIYIYYNHFSNTDKFQISNDTAKWGAFGDYLNPVLTLINIIVFLYFSYKVSHLDDNRAKEDRQTQIAITKSQMQNQEVNEIAKTLDSTVELFNLKYQKNSTNQEYHEEILQILRIIISKYQFFRANKSNLFKEAFTPKFIGEYYTPVHNEIAELISNHEHYIDVIEKFNGMRNDPEYREQLPEKLHFQHTDEYGIELNETENINKELEIREKRELKEINTKLTTHYTRFNNKKALFINELYNIILQDLEKDDRK